MHSRLCSCTVPKQGVVNFFALKKIIYGVLCEAAHICALYVGQMRVHFFMKTKLDSISFLQPGRGSREIRMLAPWGMSLRKDPKGDTCAGEVREVYHVLQVCDNELN